jgi:capsular polysaccharide export protein
VKIFIGFSSWKKTFIFVKKSFFLKKDIVEISKYANCKKNSFFIWGNKIPNKILDFLKKKNCKIFTVEDGFIRSFGLGSDLVAPKSFVIDKRGIYYDSTKYSNLENILNNIYLTKK